MLHERTTDAEIEGWLNMLGIATRCQWDVLVFLYHHQISPLGATLIAHLLGYAIQPLVAALDRLEILGLLECFPVSDSVRLYQFSMPLDPQERDAWARLLALARYSAGWMRLTGHLRGGDLTAQAEQATSQHLLTVGQQRAQASLRSLLAIQHLLAEALQRVRASDHELSATSFL